MKDFMFTVIAWLITLPLIIAAVAFAIYNGDSLPITLNPFQAPIVMPLYMPVLAGVAFGFVFGSLMTWAAMGRLRKEKRALKKRNRLLEQKLEEKSNVVNHVVPRRYNYSLIPARLANKQIP